MRQCLVEPPQRFVRIAQVVVGVDVIGCELKGSVIAGYCLLLLAQGLEGIAQVVVGIAVIRPHVDGLAEALHRAVVLAQLIGDDSQHIAGNRVIWPLLQDAGAEGLGAVEVACGVILRCDVQRLIHIQHLLVCGGGRLRCGRLRCGRQRCGRLRCARMGYSRPRRIWPGWLGQAPQ